MIVEMTPDIEIDKHCMKVGARHCGISFATDETCMKNELIFWKIRENGFDDCWIKIVHDLLLKWGMCKIK